MITELEFLKSKLSHVKKEQLQKYLTDVRNINVGKKPLKRDMLKQVESLITEQEAIQLMRDWEITITSTEMKTLLDFTDYFIRKNYDQGALKRIGSYTASYYKNEVYLYSAADAFLLAQKKPAKKQRKEPEIFHAFPPVEEYYPQTHGISRKFIIHTGPTNSGKTYQALEAMKKAKSGIYLAPLRLLAMEVADQLNNEGFPCSMITGEEEQIVPYAHYESCTVEKADINKHYDVCIIDEAQMIGSDRGAAWTRAIMGIRADETHIITAEEGLYIIKQLIDFCNDTYEIVAHERQTPLILENENFKEIRPHDALIVFSRKAALSLAAELEGKGHHISVIYGSLPYSVRKKQAELFRNGTNDVLIATDAIGMGLNLPIERVVFMEWRKFDGTRVRSLKDFEAKQIAGRAGRRGIYEKGYVNTYCFHDLLYSKITSDATDYITEAPLPFPESVLQNKRRYSTLLKAWQENSIPEPFVKCDVKRQLYLNQMIAGKKLNNITAHKLCSLPFDETNDTLLHMWLSLIDMKYSNKEINLSHFVSLSDTSYFKLDDYETAYKMLDLFYSFCKSMSCPTDFDEINKCREYISAQITKLLSQNKKSFLKRCRVCGKSMPWNSTYSMCESCYDKSRQWYYDYDDDYY